MFSSVGIRKGNWRVTLYPDGGSEMHDVEKDMWLNKNLAGKHPEYDGLLGNLVKTAAEWGLDLGIKGHDADIPVDAQNMTATNATTAKRVFSTDQNRPTAQPDHPATSTEYVTSVGQNSHIQLAPSTRALRRGGDGDGYLKNLNITGNTHDNDISLVSGGAEYSANIDIGAGDNTIHSSHAALHVHCGNGNTTVTADGGGVLHGGGGNDNLRGDRNQTEIHGGPGGRNVYAGGRGKTTIYTGHGISKVVSGPGETHIVIDGGTNTIDARRGTSKVTLKRTGLPQTIVAGEGALQFDFTDWAKLGDLRHRKEKNALILECASEHVVVRGMTEEAFKTAAHGIKLAQD
jgi:hypothetical protein